MFKRLLVAIDGTPEAAEALPAVATLARATGASITVVRVGGHGHAEAADGRLDGKLAEDEVRLAAQRLASSGLAVDWVVGTPPVAAAIMQAADARNAEVIVMATHGRTGLARAFAGSVSERVVAESGRLVLLVAPGDKQLDHIRTLLVPVDGTAGGAVALGAAVELARAAGARLVLLDVVPPTPVWMYGMATEGVMYIDPAWEDEALHSADVYVEGLAGRLRSSGLQAEARSFKGEVAATIDAVAVEMDADLVVMSTHSLTGPARSVLGSVADAVVRTSLRPVLLVRRPNGALDDVDDNSLRPALQVAG